jgi:hypothetical protein
MEQLKVVGTFVLNLFAVGLFGTAQLSYIKHIPSGIKS